MTLKPFEDYILLIASTPFGRVFFCTREMWNWMSPCTTTNIFHETKDYIMFHAAVPVACVQYVEKACTSQACPSCKGYGLVGPINVYSFIQSLGLLPIRTISPEDWDSNFRLNRNLFDQLCNIYDQKPFRDCVYCTSNSRCTLRFARRNCHPLTETHKEVRSPYFNIDINKTKAGIFPFLLLNDNLLLCNNTTIRSQAMGIFQQGMKNKPRFYVAPFKSSMSIIKIDHTVWELGYQYAVARFYKMSIKVKPFILTDDLHRQITFGTGFAKVEDYSDFLWRYRPLKEIPLVGSKVYVGSKFDREVLPFNLDYWSIMNTQLDIKTRVQIGLHRIFGLSALEHDCSNVIYDPNK
jgi:hypothetical protein